MKTQLAQIGLIALCVACTGISTDKTDDATDSGDYTLCDTADYYDTDCDTGYDTGYGVYTGATTLDTKSVSCTSHQFDFEFMTVGLPVVDNCKSAVLVGKKITMWLLLTSIQTAGGTNSC